MQSDPQSHSHAGPSHEHTPHTRGDTSPLPPSSPNLTTFHRPTADEPSLRRRRAHPAQADASGTSEGEQGSEPSLRIRIATPYSDSTSAGRRKEVSVHLTRTVAELKDDIANGAFMDERWQRDGMRLVWQGRIIRDEELIGSVVGKAMDAQLVHTFHLVARRLGGSVPAPQVQATVTQAPSPLVTQPAPLPPPAVPSSRTQQALSDSVHYLLFMIRYHLCQLLGAPPLGWDDKVPAPTVSRDLAREAVMSVVSTFAGQRSSREEGWEDWQGAFEEDLNDIWEKIGRAKLESEVQTLWADRVGRAWRDGKDGEAVLVDLDGIPYQLHLPPLDLMVPTQLCHLLLYLRLTWLLPLLNNVLNIQSARSHTPTPTTAAVLPPRVRRIEFRLQLNMATIAHIAMSAVKAIALVWMLTRDLKWGDFRFWIIGGGAFGWWAGDAMNRLRPVIRLNRPNQQAAVPPAAPGAQAGDVPAQGGAQPNPAADTPYRAPAAAARMINSHRNSNLFNRYIPLLHLDTDAEYLHLASHRRFVRPMPLVTQWLLPIALWFITLVPEWEVMRARAIRRRERAIRVIVGELTAAAALASDHAGREGVVEAGGTGETADGAGGAAEGERPNVFPEGLDGIAKNYYKRVVSRGEGIDWEEEREAQRAMRVGEEDEGRGEGDGMRMRML